MTEPTPLLILGRADVADLLGWDDCIALVREAMKAFSAGETRQLPRYILGLGGGRAYGLMACGLAEGRKLGDGARAALITRGFAELTRLGLAMGAKAETLSGLCGLGDLVLTCCSMTSRNTSLGAALGEGRTLEEVLAERRSVAEGVESAPAVVALAQKHGVEMPISSAVDDIVAGRVSIDEAIFALLSRPFKLERA